MRCHKKFSKEAIWVPLNLILACNVKSKPYTLDGKDKSADNTAYYLDETPDNAEKSEQFHLAPSEYVLI